MVRIIGYAQLPMVLFMIWGNCQNKLPGAIKSYTVVTSFDFVTLENGEFINTQDSFHVTYYQNFILYMVPKVYTFSTVTIKGDTIHEKLVSSRIAYNYFVYKNSDNFGYRFDSLEAESSQVFSVDSFLEKEAYSKFTFYNKTNDTLVASKTNRKGNELIEKYIPRIKYDETYPDSTFLYFRNEKMKYNYFSFSHYLDSLKNRKLFKIVITFNPIPKGIYSFDVPRRNMIFELKQIRATDEEKLIKFFNRVKNIYE